jgi:hypothetical protein
MHRLITIAAMLIVFVPAMAHAKRTAPPKVEPVVYKGVRYVAPNDDGRRGYVQAWDGKTNQLRWEVTVFRNLINPLLEEDVQWVYIKKLSVLEGRLIVVDERDRAYSLDLKTRTVRKLKQAPPEKASAQAATRGYSPSRANLPADCCLCGPADCSLLSSWVQRASFLQLPRCPHQSIARPPFDGSEPP